MLGVLAPGVVVVVVVLVPLEPVAPVPPVVPGAIDPVEGSVLPVGGGGMGVVDESVPIPLPPPVPPPEV